MDVLYAILNRRTITRFLDRPVEDEKLGRILEAAVWAPNHRLTEPWRFYILGREALSRFAEEMSAPLRERGENEETLARFKVDLVPAPLIVAVTYPRSPSTLKTKEDYAATCAAIQNMLLAACGLGLGSYWRTGRLVKDKTVRRFLSLPENEVTAGFVYLGYPAETGGSKRSPWQQKTIWI